MYYIINRTKNSTLTHKGAFPGDYLDDLLNKGDEIIVISTYSNTIKVPYSVELNGEIEWEYNNYNLPTL